MQPYRQRSDPDGNESTAITEWSQALGAAWVQREPDRLALLEKATFVAPGRILVHLRPGSTDELIACLRIADCYRVAVNVFSRGKNYGYGACGPCQGQTAAIELSRLTGITEFDEELGYVRVQAGVTFSQLREFLLARQSNRFLPSTGGPSGGSVLANTVERGFGLGFGGDRYTNACRYEVVTALGQRFETGFGRFEGCRIANLMRTGVGPSLDGLFTQSSLGIVTAATLWLPRRPKVHASFLLTSPDRPRIGTLFARIGEAARQGLVRDGAVFATGGYKLASIMLRREDFAPPGTALGWDDLRRHHRRWGKAAWFMCVTLEADTNAMLAAKRQAFKAVFRGHLRPGERILLLTARRARWVRWLSRLLPTRAATVVRQMLDVFYDRAAVLGHPIEQPLSTTYWALPRAQATGCEDPHADGVGLLWISVPVPLRAEEIEFVTRTIDDRLLASGFEPSTQVTLVTERLVRVITALMYNRLTPGEDQRALDCQKAVYAELQAHGYYPYRLQANQMDDYAEFGADHQATVERLKAALDPHGVIDPSRYPAARWQSATEGDPDHEAP